MKFTSQILLLLGLLFSSLVATAQSIDTDDLEAKIDAMIPTAINDTTPGLVVGIVQNGKLTFSKGYGLANLSYGIANKPEMLYNIGSVSKQFLGYAFAMLHADGLINLDDPVSKYLDDWPEFEHKVSLRHLLSHSSGYREAYAMSELAGRIVGVDHLSREECLNVVRRQKELEFVPGTRFTYNSTAWVILAEILEKATVESAAAWVDQHLLDPLKMESTRIENYVGEVMSNAAESYSYDSDRGYKNEKSNRAIFGAADILTSVNDLAKWINNIRTAEIGGEEVRSIFLDPLELAGGVNSEYALGIGVKNYRGVKRYSHNGGHEAFLTQLRYFPEQDLGIILISNFGGNGWLLASKISRLLLANYMTDDVKKEESKSIALNTKELESFKGSYISSDYHKSVQLDIMDDTLTLDDGNKLIPVSAKEFRLKNQEVRVTFNTLTKGVEQMRIVGNADSKYLKVKSWSPEEQILEKYKGDYWSDELETVYHLEMKDGQLAVGHRWLDSTVLKPITKDVFGTDWGYILKFTRDEKDLITGFSISGGRTLSVFFGAVDGGKL